MHYLVQCRHKCSFAFAFARNAKTKRCGFAFAFARIAKTKLHCSALQNLVQYRRECGFAFAFARIAKAKGYCSA